MYKDSTSLHYLPKNLLLHMASCDKIYYYFHYLAWFCELTLKHVGKNLPNNPHQILI